MAPSSNDASVSAPVKSRLMYDIKCNKCRKIVKNGILCDYCDKWSHFRCAKILEDSPPDEKSEWKCPTCEELGIASDSGEDGKTQNCELDNASFLEIINVLQHDIKSLKLENERLENLIHLKSDNQLQNNSSRQSTGMWESVKTKPSRFKQVTQNRFSEFPPLKNKFQILESMVDLNEDTNTEDKPSLINTSLQKLRLSKPKSKPKHKVKIYADSFGRGLAGILKENLSTQFEIEATVKPSATLRNVVPIMDDRPTKKEKEKGCLTPKDTIILLGGANDVYKNETQEAAAALRSTLRKMTHTSIIYVNIPRRYDLMKSSVVNSEIDHANKCFKDICSEFENVSLINTSSCNREYQTKHGQHFSYLGKKVLAKTISNVIKIRLSKNSSESRDAGNGLA